jgi:hypothetical protein
MMPWTLGDSARLEGQQVERYYPQITQITQISALGLDKALQNRNTFLARLRVV